MNNAYFATGYLCSMVFYIFESVAVIIAGLVFHTIPPLIILGFAAVIFGTLIILYRGKKKRNLSEYAHERVQSLAFVVPHFFLSIALDSAQCFIYALCLSTVVLFVFLDPKLARFQFLSSLIFTIVGAVYIEFLTVPHDTIRTYGVGALIVLIMNWVIISITYLISYQNRKNYEQELSLDDMLRVVEAKCDEAREATRSKTRFLANMSHEIRTPINTVIGMNEMILRECDDQQIRNYAADTKVAAQSLLGIINDILDITKIESGKMTIILSEYKLVSLIYDVYNLNKLKAEDKKLAFELYIDPNLPSVLVGDDMRIKQILINLLSNAVKYTHEGSVSLEIKYLGDGELYFAVKDTGIGIKHEDIKRLFNAFDRIEENRNRNIEGTGLGLNIASSLLKSFGSELKVDSVYGKGSKFWFVIKQEIADAAPIGTPDMSARELEYKPHTVAYEAPSARVLIVDDNVMNRKVFVNLLKDTKIIVDEAGSGMDCLEMIKYSKYDIIFMDHMMPEMDGVETLEAMRKQEDNLCKGCPVIVLTANAISGAREFYMQSGFTNFLPKPIEPAILEEMVFNTLDKNLLIPREGQVVDNKPKKSTDIELPIITGIDWSYAMLHFKDEKSMLETVKLFYSAIKSDAEKLNGLYDNINNGEESVAQYRVKVHSMKSSATMIGIVSLAGMAMELERAARNGNIKAIKAMHSYFIERWLSYRKPLEELAEPQEPKKTATDCRKEIEDIFVTIRAAAQDMDVDALDEMSKKLDEYRFSGAAEERIQEVKDSILNFEVEKLSEYEFVF